MYNTSDYQYIHCIAMEYRESSAVLEVLLLPWLAHGHISPFLELAKRLSHEYMIRVHLCSTPVNLVSIKQQLHDCGAFPSINLVELHLPIIDNNTSILLQQPHLQSTQHLPSHLMPALKTAFDLSEPVFSQLLQDLSPDLVIYDFLQPWAPRAANKLNIPAVLFFSTAAASAAFFYHQTEKPGEKFPFPEITAGDSAHHCVKHMDNIHAQFLKRTANGMTEAERFMQCIALSSSFVVIKTFREIESKYMDYLSSLMGKELVPVGPLIPETVDEDNEKNLIHWLDNKEKSSVVYVSFGTEYFMEEKEIKEIAHGLEMSKVSFIWVVRFPATLESESESDFSVHGLKKNKVNVSEDIGLIIEGWAPQREILSHASVGGFLTHCGWSSVMEGMRFGVPIIAMPLQLDQPLNAKLVVHLGVGVEIKGEQHCCDDDEAATGFMRRRVFKRGDIAEGINEIVSQSKTAVTVRRKAKEMAEIIGLKGTREISFLVEKMALLCTKRKDKGAPDIFSLGTD